MGYTAINIEICQQVEALPWYYQSRCFSHPLLFQATLKAEIGSISPSLMLSLPVHENRLSCKVSSIHTPGSSGKTSKGRKETHGSKTFLLQYPIPHPFFWYSTGLLLPISGTSGRKGDYLQLKKRADKMCPQEICRYMVVGSNQCVLLALQTVFPTSGQGLTFCAMGLWLVQLLSKADFNINIHKGDTSFIAIHW